MHRGRFGGNARKRKAKLTDATFHAVLGATPRPAPVAILEPEEAVVEAAAALAVAVREPAYAALPSAPVPHLFQAQDYDFGYATCAHCHNDQAYYVRRTMLSQGYTFRCRICCLEMTVATQAEA